MASTSLSWSKNTFLVFGLGALTGWFAYFLSQRIQASSSSSTLVPSPREHGQHAFFLGVSVRFPSDEDQKEFERIFKPLSDHVRKNELGTLSYIVMRSDKEARHIMILERYKNKQYYLDVHKTSEPFKTFRDQFQELISKGAVVDGHSYVESDLGFIF
eukprot:gene8632-9512_t